MNISGRKLLKFLLMPMCSVLFTPVLKARLFFVLVVVVFVFLIWPSMQRLNAVRVKVFRNIITIELLMHS